MPKPVPFRTSAERDATRKRRATRARRKELLLIARSAKSLDLLPASALERLFWDVDAWAGAIPADHPNAVPALALSQRVKAEYRRRNQETPLVAGQRLAIQVMEELL